MYMAIRGKHRSYCFTINNDTEDDLMKLLETEFKYLIIGFETGVEGTRHIQGYIQFYNPLGLNTVKKVLPRAHIEVPIGSPAQNIEYCSKDHEYYELGTRPTLGGRVTFDQVREAYLDPDNNLTIIRQYGQVYKEVQQLHIKKTEVMTSFFTIRVVEDLFTELNDYFGSLEHFIFVSNLNEISAYDDDKVESVVFLMSWMDPLIKLYPRGVPIIYKYGYQHRIIKPINFIVVSNEDLPGYLQI